MVDVNRIKEGPCSNDSNNIVSVEQKTFAEDSWETIANAIKAGKATAYEVGEKKEITIDGYGTLTVRVANNTTPNECTAEGLSQTACGFVIEFEDVITTYNMNSSDTNVGGWKDSEMRSWLNTTLYNALPKELKKIISDTLVISGHGPNDTDNFTTIDKMYLLSTKEIWGSGIALEYDTAVETRQLDYYKNLEVSSNNYNESKKYNLSGSLSTW